MTDIARRRAERGVAQAELAARCGVSRQFLSMVESGRTQPNVQIALRLAAELGCPVEDIFATTHVPGASGRDVEFAGMRPAAGARLDIVRIGGKWIAHPSDTPDSLGGGFAPSDGMAVIEGRRTTALFHRSTREIELNIVIAGCDPAIALLGERSARISAPPAGRCAWINCGSARALKMLANGWVHAAGLHFPGTDADGNLRQIRRHDPAGNWHLLHFTRWENGWMIGPGAHGRFRDAGDLADKRLRFANRETGAGNRVWFDAQLKRADVRPTHVRGYAEERASHWACARALLDDRADVAVGPRAIAIACGLDFAPADEVTFDIVVPKAHLDHPRIQAMLQQIRGRAFQRDVETLPGYDATEAGTRVSVSDG